MQQTIGALVRKAERDYTSGTTIISKYVTHQMGDTLARIDAYLNSKHITGDTDTLGRDKPFFDISTSNVNVWYRATRIFLNKIKIRATKQTDWVDAFLATIHLRDWMRRENFGLFLSLWGLTLARYGSAVVKFVENNSGLHIAVIPWQTIICDAVDFDANIKIEILELSEAQLRERVDTHGYDKQEVENLIISAQAPRQTIDRQRKDNKTGYFKLYEIHGKLTQYQITGKDGDDTKSFKQRMAVISYVGLRNGRKTEYKDFVLVSGTEANDPYMLTHLIPTDGRTLSIGAVEHLFEAQWMVNHAIKTEKDTLDLSSILAFQTSDPQFLGRNFLGDMTSGDVLIHTINQPLTKVDMSKPDIQAVHNFAMTWKMQGNETNNISDSMLGNTAPSGTAWRQVARLLQESHSLFDIMTDNKALDIKTMLHERIIPYIKKHELDHADEIGATLELHEIHQIDSIYVKRTAIDRYNEHAKAHILAGRIPAPFNQNEAMQQVQQEMQPLGNQRFFKPSDISDTTWKQQLNDLAWETEIDITDDDGPSKEDMETITTAFQTVAANPYALINPTLRAQYFNILALTGAMSPLEIVQSQPAIPLPAKTFRETLDYADAPEDIKRQMEEQLGFEPSKMGTPATPGAPTPNAPTAKAPVTVGA